MMNLGRLDTIPQGEGRIFDLGHTSIAVFHTRSGGVFATEPSCPHKAGPLADGIIGERQVVCPLHAFVFDLSNGEPLGNNCTALKTYRATITEEGEIVVVF